MLKKIFKTVVYLLGTFTLIGLVCSACTNEESETYIEHKGQNQIEIVKPEEPEDGTGMIVTTPEESEDFTFIEGPECIKGDFSNNIVGVVRNNTDKTYDYLQISFTIYDEHGNVIDSAFANVNNVKPGSTWRFEAMFFNNNAASWELDEITGW